MSYVVLTDNTQDQQLAEMLAAMEDDHSQAASQAGSQAASQAGSQAASQALSRVATLEEADSILSQTSSPQVRVSPQEQAEDEEQEERDMLDLSQSEWGEEIPEAEAAGHNNQRYTHSYGVTPCIFL